MLFNFNVNMTDQDYLDYNIFIALTSPYGKKNIIKARFIMTVPLVILCLFLLYRKGFPTRSSITVLSCLLMIVISQLIYVPLLKSGIKKHINKSKKKGKLGYTPISTHEFYEDSFVEISPDGRIEAKYSTVERVSIVKNKVIYLHINYAVSHILPLSCFESKEQFEDFIAFISTKCANVDRY